MARNFEYHWQGGVGSHRPNSAGAAPDTVPTTLEPCDSFQANSDRSVILECVLPDTYTGAGTLKLDVMGGANTTTAADDVRWNAQTEFRTPGAGEAINADNFDATPDSATMTFSTTAYSLQKATISLTPAVTPAKGDRVRIKLTRDADHATDDSLAVPFLATDYNFYEEV